MIIDGNTAGHLLEQFKIAQEVEGAAITALHHALKGGMKDTGILMDLTDRMTESHNKKMALWAEIQKHRLDI
jgi:hypothetical protein